jgi:ubiquinone/menaquinone biosynthesis C-methylase UbiE
MERTEAARPLALMDMICGKWTTQMLSTAAELRVADALKDGALTAREVAEATRTDPHVLYRLLRALANVGVLDQLDGERFALTELGQPLRSDVPGSLRFMAMLLGQPWHSRIWEALSECVKTGTAFGATHALGMSIRDYFDRDASAADLFNRAMTGRATVTYATTVEACDFSGVSSLVDVGGGYGRLLSVILQRYQSMRGVLFELPYMADGARAELSANGVIDRCEFVGGSFLESIPSGGDAYVLSHVLHNWSDGDARTILRNCRQAMKVGGRLLVVDALVKPDRERDWAKLVDLEMMMLYGGRERTLEELAALLRGSGFEVKRVIPTRSLDSVVESTAV